MDWSSTVQTFAASGSPLLPATALLKVALPLFWAVVLAAVALGFCARLARPVRLGVAIAVALWACVPGTMSPTYWLGLAFQMPSLTGLLLGGVWVFNGLGTALPVDSPDGALAATAHRRAVDAVNRYLAILGIALGWVLLADSFALFGVSIYHWGFGLHALAWVGVLAFLPWVVAGGGIRRRLDSYALLALPAAVLALFIVTRLPTGNVWDVMLDPWLWLGLHLHVLLRWRKSRQVRQQSINADQAGEPTATRD